MPAARPARIARRTTRCACLRLGLPLKQRSVLHTTTMPPRASTNAALDHTPAVADNHDLGAASVSHDPTPSATVTSSNEIPVEVWVPNPNFPRDPRPFCPPRRA